MKQEELRKMGFDNQKDFDRFCESEQEGLQEPTKEEIMRCIKC